MVSDLKWRMGFGWGSVSMLFTALAAAAFTAGNSRFTSLSLGVCAAVYMIRQYRKWNGEGWPSLHWRAMVLYAVIAGEEQRQADSEGRPFNIREACRQLALRMSRHHDEVAVDQMIASLSVKKGFYLGWLIRKHQDELARMEDLHANDISTLAEQMEAIDFGPHLVICEIIQNSFSSVEAARYTLALAKRRAY